MIAEILGGSALVMAAFFGYLGVRRSSTATSQTTQAQQAIDGAAKKAEADTNAGKLALELAETLGRRVTQLETQLADVQDDLSAERTWQDEVREAWHRYEDWGDLVLTKLDAAVPGATAGLPKRPTLPSRPKLLRRRDRSAVSG